jgi:diacylglycerol kinase family enzyme
MADIPLDKWVVVINRAAGVVLTEPAARFETIQRFFQERGLEAEIVQVAGSQIEGAIRSALREGASRIIVGGGDGTISTAAAVLAHGAVPLGILPMGTLNHLAKHLGIPADLAAAVDVIVGGEVRRIDLGEVNGCLFVNNSSIGGYPRVIRFRDHQQRHRGRHKWSALAYAFIRFLQRYRTMHVLLQLDGKTVARKTPFVFVGNNEYDPDKSLTATRGTLTAGCLCVYTARCDHWLQFLRLFGLLLANRLGDAPEFEAHSVCEARVQTRHRYLDVSRDGEISSMEMPLRYRIHCAALAVIVPGGASL